MTGDEMIRRAYRAAREMREADRVRRLEAAVEKLDASPVAGPAPDDEVSHGLTPRQIKIAAAQEQELVQGHPSMLNVATRLNTSESTLKRARAALRLPWPPGPPPAD